MAELQVVALHALCKAKAKGIAIRQMEQIVKDVWQKVYNAAYE